LSGESLKKVRIGSGAGYSGDRIDPAVELARHAKLDYLVFECLAERTLALAQQSRDTGNSDGYDPLLVERLTAVLPECHRQGIKIISNMGAANPLAAARKASELARSMGLRNLRIAAVLGDDVLSWVRSSSEESIIPNGPIIRSGINSIISANAYLGAAPVLDALVGGADIVLTGRVADPSLFVAPLMYEFGWSPSDWNQMGQATVIGHLLECAGQLTGGYYADPGYKDVANLAWLGFPYAQVSADGSAVFGKVEGSGGLLSQRTCKEQLLYEIQDPHSYLTPDVVADFSGVKIGEIGQNSVAVFGGAGREKPKSLKVMIAFRDGYISEGQISYAGHGAVNRARLAISVLEERLRPHNLEETRFDLIGMNSIHGEQLSCKAPEPYEVRVRAVGRARTHAQAHIIAREVEALYTNGPAGGGGVSTSTREAVNLTATLIPSDRVTTSIHYEVS